MCGTSNSHGERFVGADERLTAFMELERVTGIAFKEADERLTVLIEEIPNTTVAITQGLTIRSSIRQAASRAIRRTHRIA